MGLVRDLLGGQCVIWGALRRRSRGRGVARRSRGAKWALVGGSHSSRSSCDSALFALLGGGALFRVFFFTCLAIALVALFTFFPCRTFRRQLGLALLFCLALPFFLLFAFSFQTLFLVSALALAFNFALFLLCCPPASLFLLPRPLLFSLLSGRFSPRLLVLTLLLLGRFELGLLLLERRFLSGFFSRPLRTSLLFCLFLLPARPDGGQQREKE